MTTQFERFENLTDSEFAASYNFWIRQSKFIYANMLLYQLHLAPMLLVDMTNYDQYDEFVMIFNKAVLLGLLTPPSNGKEPPESDDLDFDRQEND